MTPFAFNTTKSLVIETGAAARLAEVAGAAVGQTCLLVTDPGLRALGLADAAIASLTQCLGRDHAHQNIRVNAVCPNEVNTPMLRTGFSIRGLDPDTAIEDLNASVPLGRIAEPEDIADVIAFLASEEARYICGALVEVNGGKPVA